MYEGKMMNRRELATEAVALAHKSLWTRGGELVLKSPHVTGRDAIGACKVMGLVRATSQPFLYGL
jgi:hypothetical protein